LFDPTVPIVIGSLLEEELEPPSLQWVKVKRHRFYARKPKALDPLVVTIGWRRFQVLPVFFNEERGGRNRFLKYMPDFVPCWATFFGPPSAVNVGVTAFQHLRERLETFRITATGVTVEPMGDGTVVKKLRVNGHPSEIFEKTAKIADMFTSPIEATQFVGGLVRTVSGIRGVIKKVEKNGVVRCTFEDTLKPSDIVFLNTWVKVIPDELFTPVNSLLSREWNLVRTTAELRAERGLRPEYKEDSVYKPVERPENQEQVLPRPRALKAQLPYALKKQFEVKPARKAQILNEDEAAVLDVVRKTSELYERKRRDQEKADAARTVAEKKAAEAEEAIKMHKRTHRKQEFFKRNPKRAKK
jgi:ribosome biogenesis protein BMS1